jgi:hypothetical protein
LDLLGIHITEPDVALTDYLLTVECIALPVWLYLKTSAKRISLIKWYLLFYVSVAIASLAGGTFHGFFTGPRSAAGSIIWCFTLIAIGANALSSWNLSAELLELPERKRFLILVLSAIYFILYSIYVAVTVPKFLVAVIGYVPATLFLLYAAWRTWQSSHNKAAACGVIGMVLTIVAAIVQQTRISIHPQYFNYNALYHVIQGIALLIFARFALWTLEQRGADNSGVVQ